MIKYLLTISLFLFTVSSYAHQVDMSSTVLSQQKDDSWILQIKAPLTAFQFEVKHKFGDSSYTSTEEFQELVLQLLKEHIAINFDQNDEVKLEGVTVRLGHETNVIFKVIGIPEKFNTIDFTNSSFKNIHKNRSALIIFKEGFSQKQFVLNNKNKHTVKLKVQNARLVEVNPANNSINANSSMYIILFALGVSGIMFFLKSRAKSNKIL